MSIHAYIYIYIRYIDLFCKFSQALPLLLATSCWRNRNHAEQDESQMAALDIPLALHLSRVPRPVHSSRRFRKLRNLSLWTTWRMDNANWIPMTRYHWCVPEICNSCGNNHKTHKKKKRRRSWETDRRADRHADEQTNWQAEERLNRREATITLAIWGGDSDCCVPQIDPTQQEQQRE